METILVLSGVNETGLLRTMSWHGSDSFGMRVMDAAELAQYALICSGRLIPEKPVDLGGRRLLMLKALEADPAGTAGFSADYYDLGKLIDALDRLRLLIPENEAAQLKERLAEGEFKDKNAALFSAYEGYMSLCAREGVIDRIGIIRYAAENCTGLRQFRLLTLSERPLQPLEKRLTEVLGGSEETSLEKLYKAEGLPRKAGVGTFRAYGASNEALQVIETILSEKRSFDSCTVAAADTRLSPALFLELGQRFGIKMTFGCGVPMGCTSAADLLVRLQRWTASGFGASALEDMINSRAFNRQKLKRLIAQQCGIKPAEVLLKDMLRIAGRLRLGCDIEVNRQRMDNCSDPLVDEEHRQKYETAFPQTRVLAEELGKGIVYLLRKYCIARSGLKAVDNAAVRSAAAEMSAYSAVTGRSPADIIPELLTRNVGHSLPQPDSLYITSAEQAVFSLRDRLFVTGLSAGNFPGTPTEDPLTLDSDLRLFADLGAVSLPTSDELIIGRKKQADGLAELAAKLCDGITLSYSYFNAAELKRANMSTALHSMYCAAAGSEDMSYEELLKVMPDISYFGDGLTADRLIGRGYCQNRICTGSEKHSENTSVNCLDKNKNYSPSAVEDLFKCPKKFFLQRILGIPDEEHISDYTVTEAYELGLLIHELMDALARKNRKVKRHEFEKLASDTFDRFLSSKIPLTQELGIPAKEEFMLVAMNTYDMEMKSGTSIVKTECKVCAEHSSGLKLEGRLDRLEEEKDSSDEKKSIYVIGDFKTGRRIKQTDADNHTWLQTMLYAYMVTCQDAKDGKDPKPVRCEYRYPRAETVSKDYSVDIAEEIIKTFTEHLTDGDFPLYNEAVNDGLAIESNDCEYCSYSGICGKEELL